MLLSAQKNRPDELVDPKARELYFVIGQELDHYPLGSLPDEQLEAYREAPGTLEERRRLSFHSTPSRNKNFRNPWPAGR